jgi:Domain of unknown function (DUF3883)
MGMAVERLLQLRAFEPLRELRRFLRKNPSVSPEDACVALIALDESFSASDHEAARELHNLIDPGLLFGNFDADLRLAIASIVVTMRPEWAKRVYLGRARFLSEIEHVDAEVRRCFNQAGLFVENPPQDVILWWDELNHQMRGIFNFDNSMQGRAAELESLKIERQKLKDMGIDATPKWQSIDDNTLGYDILSYRASGGEFPSNLLIEVKSSRQNPPVAIISRNECKKAEEAKDRYLFHVWHVKDGKPFKLYEWSYDMVAEHVPKDNGQGKWTDVAIPIKAIKTA